ncbi:MAG TPA: bifunctional diguanylate cyclase/phosphodiesterase [Actinoplanes sp.]|nr:bifunctional diguanylate cyclase/phosphodiesterase [Actinoplanes sp.]
MPILAELAVPAKVWDAETAIPRIEEALSADDTLAGIVTRLDGRIHLLDRAYLNGALTGRLGFGRPLLHRRTLRVLCERPALVLPGDMAWDDAARAALARPVGSKGLPVVVDLGGGALGTAIVGPLADHLSVRYRTMALQDDLTGLGNRRLLTEHVTAALGDGIQAAFVIIGLNRFKEINDSLGHTHGDELLQHVTRALQRECMGGTAFRLGGDEFVLFAGTTSLAAMHGHSLPEALLHLGERVLQAIQGPFTIAGVPVTVEASLGIAHTGQPGMDAVGRLLAAADSAMNTAKRDRTRVELFDPAGSSPHIVDLGILSELRDAVPQGHLVLHYQPLVDAHTREIVSFEALVRWAHPQRGLLYPGAFLPQAERSDVIHALTDRALADATAQAAAWHRAGWPVPVAVNLAAPVLTSDHVVDTIARHLHTTGLPGSALIVEITESAVMTRPEESARRLKTLQDLGVRVAMDDFGTGYTSLALLTELPLDELKLDRTFIMRVHDRREQVIVDAVARMADGLGLTLVAEGVEDEATARTLTGLGIDQLQGYHFSRPLPASNFPPAPMLPPARPATAAR